MIDRARRPAMGGEGDAMQAGVQAGVGEGLVGSALFSSF